MSPQGYKNMDLESQDPIFNANLGQDENLIWTKKLRCSQSIGSESSELFLDQRDQEPCQYPVSHERKMALLMGLSPSF